MMLKPVRLKLLRLVLKKGRLDGARVDVAVFTNLTRDHLDYHGSMDNYAAAKEKLFVWPRLRLAVINLDDPFGQKTGAIYHGNQNYRLYAK